MFTRNFNISLLFSTAWHLLWISSICIVITPTVRFEEQHTDVNFLGPILEKTAFEIMVENITPHTETLYNIQPILDEKLDLEAKGPEKLTKKDVFAGKTETEINIGKKINLETLREKPVPITDKKDIFYHLEEKEINKSIEGPAQKRMIVFKPPMPLFQKSTYRDEAIFSAKFKFTVAKNGAIEFIEPIVSSGDPYIDIACIKYLKQWKFSPDAVSKKEKDWGIVTLDIRTE